MRYRHGVYLVVPLAAGGSTTYYLSSNNWDLNSSFSNFFSKFPWGGQSQ
ncbi:hypothetical protein [Mycoplasma parvum]|nr:hypothetical protein [Mycoplasma parvum]